MKYTYIIALLFISASIFAQTSFKESEKNNEIYIRGGLEPNLMISLGYQHSFELEKINRDLTIFAELKTSLVRFSLFNSEVKTGATIPIIQAGSFKIINNLNFSISGVETINFNSLRIAVGDEIAIGFYGNIWFAAFIVEYERALCNYITHTDFYKNTHYSDAVDGWYKGASGAFQFGLEGGILISKLVDVNLEVKVPVTEHFNGFSGSPFHVNLGVGLRF